MPIYSLEAFTYEGDSQVYPREIKALDDEACRFGHPVGEYGHVCLDVAPPDVDEARATFVLPKDEVVDALITQVLAGEFHTWVVPVHHGTTLRLGRAGVQSVLFSSFFYPSRLIPNPTSPDVNERLYQHRHRGYLWSPEQLSERDLHL